MTPALWVWVGFVVVVLGLITLAAYAIGTAVGTDRERERVLKVREEMAREKRLVRVEHRLDEIAPRLAALEKEKT